MSTRRICERCGSPLELPSGGTELCARCLARSLAPDGDDETAADATGVTLPRMFGAYELLAEIGRGGMGVVYRARQLALDRIVAVKLLLAGAYSSEVTLRRFRLEAAAAASLQHPNIVPIHDYGECDGQPFYAMNLIVGRDLADVCSGRPLKARRAAQLIAVLARAVHYAHGAGIAHRDLKPSNVLIDADDRPQITDFGLAKRLDCAEGITVTGQMIGSPSYAAPEQALGRDDQVGVPSDVYGLGALLYHLVTGRAPFGAATPTETLRLVLETDPPPPRLLNPGLPRELETIGLVCLAKEPARRYSTAGALADDCERFLDHRPIRARRPSAAYRFRKFVRRHRFGFVAATTLAALAVIGLAMLVRASRAEAMAQQRRVQIEQIFSAALRGADPGGYSRGRQATLKDLLDDTARWVPGEFADDPRLAADIHARIGETYCKLSLFEDAVPHLEIAWAARRRLFPEEHPDYLTSLRDLGVLRLWQQRYAEAEEHLGRVLAIQERTLGRDAGETLRTRNEMVFGREIRLTLGVSIPDEDRVKFIDEHRRFARESHDLARNRWGDEHPLNLVHELHLARALLWGEAPQVEEAQRLIVHCHETSARVLGPEDPVTIDAMTDRGRVLLLRRSDAEAVQLLKACVPLAERVLGPEHAATAWAMQQLEEAWRRVGRVDEANALIPRYVVTWIRTYGPQNRWNLVYAFRRLHRLSADYGRPEEAARVAMEQLSEFRDRRHLPPDSPAIGMMLLVLADARLMQQRVSEAQQCVHEATAILGQEQPPSPQLWLMCWRLGDQLRKQRQFDQAEAELLVAYEGVCDGRDPATRPICRWILESLMRLHAEAGRLEKAAEWSQRLDAFARAEAETPR